MGSWQVFLANSDDLSRNADITSEAHDLQLDLALNAPGSCSFSVPLFSDNAGFLGPVRHAVIVQKNKVVVWSGMVWSKTEDLAAQKIQIEAIGWLEILHKRIWLDNEHLFNNVNAGSIIFQLLDSANTYADTWISAGGTPYNTNTQTRTITIEKLQNIGDQIQQLTELENGVDIEITPNTRILKVHSATDYDVSDAVFGFNIGALNTVSATRTTTGDDMANEQYVQGKVVTAFAHNALSIAIEGQIFQNVISLSETTDATLLGAIANAEAAVNGFPRILIDFTPKALDSLNTNEVPSLFEDYSVGSQVTFSAKRDSVQILGQAVRVFGVGLSIDSNGTEKITSLATTFQSGG